MIKMSRGLHDETLVYILKGDDVLLGYKIKKALGHEMYNGFGGKVEAGETVEAAAIRETQEECGLVVSALEKVAELDFFFTNPPDDGSEWDRTVHVYLAREGSWSGEPVETGEMRPVWFSRGAIPYERTWEDDPFWLPRVLDGELIKGYFCFAEDNSSIQDYAVGAVEYF